MNDRKLTEHSENCCHQDKEKQDCRCGENSAIMESVKKEEGSGENSVIATGAAQQDNCGCGEGKSCSCGEACKCSDCASESHEKEIKHNGEKEISQKDGACCHGGTAAFAGCCGEIKTGKSAKNKLVYSIVALSISLAALIVSFIAPFKNHEVLKYLDFGWIAIFLCGISIYVNAIKGLKNKKITSSLLISVSITACIVLEILMLTGALPHDGHGHSNIFAGGEVAFLMAIGSLIEEITVRKARSGIERLAKLSPKTVKKITASGIVETAVEEIRVGDRVLILAGDIIGIDGKIVSGSTSIDEAVMTGESVPRDKTEGDLIYGGTVNKDGKIEAEVLKASNDMTLNKIKKLVAEAEGKKAPISKLADKWAGYIVPAAIGFAGIIFLLSMFAFRVGVAESVIRAVTMLIVFCPCALALATPTAVAAGLGNGAKNGILVKSGGALEETAKINVVAFDKTGTLTEGKLVITDAVPFNGDKAFLLAFTAGLESGSNHPIAKALTEYCKDEKPLVFTQIKTAVGVGLNGIYQGKTADIVKFDTISGQCAVAVQTTGDALMEEGKTVIAARLEGEVIGLFALSDRLRDTAVQAIKELEEMGIKTAMLTGDNDKVAESIGKKLGLTAVYSSLMPEDKVTKLASIKGDGKVCMVGDGVNDAPALACADVSIAMGALGSDVAIETASVSLMSDDLTKVPRFIRLSKRVLKTIKINIILSMTINFVSVILSALGLLNPISGAIVHNISSILVVCNSALILAHKGRRGKALPLKVKSEE